MLSSPASPSSGSSAAAIAASAGTPNDAARREVFARLITDWIEKRRLDNALSREELAALDSLQRLLAQRHSLVDGLGHYFAVTERADVATGILVLITFLADNNQGACTLSIPRMAQFFHRSQRAISEAIARLEQAEVIFVERLHHQSSSYWPVVHRELAGQQTPLMWFVGARAPASRPSGRPAKQKPPEADSGGISETPRSRAQNPPKPASGNTTKYTTKEKKEDAVRVGFDGRTITLHGDCLQFWLDKFGGDAERLDFALIAAVPYIQPNSSKPLEVQVSAQLARSAADKRDKDKRAEARAAQPGVPRKTKADAARDALNKMHDILRARGHQI